MLGIRDERDVERLISKARRGVKVVADTNVLVSALIFPGGPPEEVYRLALGRQIELVTSRPLLAELGRVLTDKFGWEPERAEEAVAQLIRIAHVIDPGEPVSDTEDDAADNRKLEAAAGGDVDAIVSGDRHLLDRRDLARNHDSASGHVRCRVTRLSTGSPSAKFSGGGGDEPAQDFDRALRGRAWTSYGRCLYQRLGGRTGSRRRVAAATAWRSANDGRSRATRPRSLSASWCRQFSAVGSACRQDGRAGSIGPDDQRSAEALRRAPFALSDAGEPSRLVERAGFYDCAICAETGSVRFASAAMFVRSYIGGSPLAAIVATAPTPPTKSS